MPVGALLLLGAAFLLLVLGRVAWQWFGYRQKRLITCPENQHAAGVQLDAWHAALTGMTKPEFRLSACTRWPERSGCGQECLRQIEAAPLDCEVRRILSHWYAGKKCAFCGLSFGEILWDTRKPALLRSDKRTVEWAEIPVDELPALLQESAPVCFACHIAGKFVREHPELALDRGRSPFPESQTLGKT